MNSGYCHSLRLSCIAGCGLVSDIGPEDHLGGVIGLCSSKRSRVAMNTTAPSRKSTLRISHILSFTKLPGGSLPQRTDESPVRLS